MPWYRCKNWEGNSEVCERCGLSSTVLGESLLPSRHLRNADEHCNCNFRKLQSCERVMPYQEFYILSCILQRRKWQWI